MHTKPSTVKASLSFYNTPSPLKKGRDRSTTITVSLCFDVFNRTKFYNVLLISVIFTIMYLLYYGKQQPETAIKESSISSRITGKGFQRLRGVMLK